MMRGCSILRCCVRRLLRCVGGYSELCKTPVSVHSKRMIGMKVLIASGAYPPHIIGGGEIATQRLAEALQDAGVSVAVLAGCNYDAEENINGVRVTRAKIPHAYWVYDHLKVRRRGLAQRAQFHTLDSVNVWAHNAVQSYLLKEKPDIFLVSVVDGLSPMTFRLGLKPSPRIIYVLRSYILCCLHGSMFRRSQVCTKQCLRCHLYSLPRKHWSRHLDGVISVSTNTLQRHTDAGFFRNARTAVIGDVVDLPALPDRSNHAGKVTFGFIGQLKPEKGVHLLIEALQDDALRTRCELLIAGSGREDYVRDLQERSRDMPVKWLGWVNPEQVYPQVDVSVLPSVWPDPMPLVVCESFSWGIPVIVSPNGGLPEHVREGENGFKMRQPTAQDLRACMSAVVDAPERLPAMRKNARACAASKFNRSAIADQYMRFFESVLHS
jgi:glycosyltransferase involved in cell wall biosynthesis